jgi:hypothetical protein
VCEKVFELESKIEYVCVCGREKGSCLSKRRCVCVRERERERDCVCVRECLSKII